MTDIASPNLDPKGAQGLESKGNRDDKDLLTTLFDEVTRMKEQVSESLGQIREQRTILFLGYIICILMVATIFITFLIFLFDKITTENSTPQFSAQHRSYVYGDQ